MGRPAPRRAGRRPEPSHRGRAPRAAPPAERHHPCHRGLQEQSGAQPEDPRRRRAPVGCHSQQVSSRHDSAVHPRRGDGAGSDQGRQDARRGVRLDLPGARPAAHDGEADPCRAASPREVSLAYGNRDSAQRCWRRHALVAGTPVRPWRGTLARATDGQPGRLASGTRAATGTRTISTRPTGSAWNSTARSPIPPRGAGPIIDATGPISPRPRPPPCASDSSISSIRRISARPPRKSPRRSAGAAPASVTRAARQPAR